MSTIRTESQSQPAANLTVTRIGAPVSILVIGGIVLVAAALRLLNLGTHGLWTDEFYSLDIARRGFAGIWETSRIDWHPPLFYWILSAVLEWLPATVENIRLAPAILGVAATALIGVYLTRRYGTIAGISGTLFLGLSTVQVYYAHEARSYTLSVVAVVLSLLAMDGFERVQNWRNTVLLAVAFIVCLYSNYVLGFVVGAQLLYLFLRVQGAGRAKLMTILGLVIFAGLMLVPNALKSLTVWSEFNRNDSGGRVVELRSALSTMLIGDERYINRPSRYLVTGAWLFLALVGIFVQRWKSIVYALPIAVLGLIMFVVLPTLGMKVPAYQDKQFVAFAPLAWALAATGVAWLWSRKQRYMRAAILAGWAIWCAIALAGYWGYATRLGDSLELQVTNFLADAVDDDETILVAGAPGASGALRYYQPQQPYLFLVKTPDDGQPLWIDGESHELMSLQSEEQRCAVGRAANSAARWFVTFADNPSTEQVLTWLGADAHLPPTQIVGYYHLFHLPAGNARNFDVYCLESRVS